MLAPDKNVAIANMAGLIEANARAMLWSQLMTESVLPPVNDPPNWYKKINIELEEANAEAEAWLSTSGPALFAEVSEATLSYGTLFTAAAPRLEQAVGPSRRSGKPMSASERETAGELVKALLAEARNVDVTVRRHMDALASYQQRIHSSQKQLNTYRKQAILTRTETSAKIRDVEKEVGLLREVLAANETTYQATKVGFATGTAGIIYAVAVAPIFAAGTLSMGIVLSLGGMGLTIWKLETYTSVLKDTSAKLNKLLKNIKLDEIESLMVSCVIDNMTTLEGAAEKANVVLSAMIAIWQQTIGDLTTLGEIVSGEANTMDRYSNLQTLTTAAATWGLVMKVANDIQQMKFQTTKKIVI